MPRKKIILDSEVKESPIITKKEFKEYKARMIVNSRIYAKDDTSSYLVGVAMIGETITVEFVRFLGNSAGKIIFARIVK